MVDLVKPQDHCLLSLNSAFSLDEARAMETLLICCSLLVVDSMPSLGRGQFGEREREKKGGVGGLVFDVFWDMAVPAILVSAWQAEIGESKKVIMRLTTSNKDSEKVKEGGNKDLLVTLTAEKFQTLLHGHLLIIISISGSVLWEWSCFRMV